MNKIPFDHRPVDELAKLLEHKDQRVRQEVQFALADKTDSIEAVVFPKLYKEHAALIVPGICLLIKGNVSKRCGEIPQGYPFYLWYKAKGYENMGHAFMTDASPEEKNSLKAFLSTL